jgi:hypothetical protein
MLPRKLSAEMKLQGMRSGDPDLRLECKAGTIYFELKSPTKYKRSEKTGKVIIDRSGGRLSKEQKNVHAHLKAYGRKVFVVDSLIEFKKIVRKYII